MRSPLSVAGAGVAPVAAAVTVAGAASPDVALAAGAAAPLPPEAVAAGSTRYGMDAVLYWPGMGAVPATELVLRRLLPMAAEGLERWGVAAADRERLLGIIGERCRTGRNGAGWQIAAAARHGGSLAAMLSEYRERMHSNVPVHEWPA